MTLQVQSTGESDIISLEGWEINANIKIDISRSALKVAPERFTFQVSGWTGFNTTTVDTPLYDARLHEIVYFANFGDPDTHYTAPRNTLNMWSDRNSGFGPRLSHVYRKPGTYTVTIWAYELGSDKQAKWTDAITVGDPEMVFSGSDTAYVSVASDFTNAPARAGQYSTLAEAISARAAATKTRFMLKTGETHSSFAQLQVPNGHVHVVNDHDRSNDADTDYTRPVLDADPAAGYLLRVRDFANRDVVFQGLEFRGPWDSRTETGDGTVNGITFFPSAPNPRHGLIDDCLLTGFQRSIDHPGSGSYDPQVSGLTVHDCFITNWRDYGIYCGGAAHIDILGCRVQQDVDALNGGPKGSTHNNHGPVRLQTATAQFVAIDGCDLFSRTGWFENIANYHTIQPCLRFNQSTIAGSLLNCQRSSMEGGFPIISLWVRPMTPTQPASATSF